VTCVIRKMLIVKTGSLGRREYRSELVGSSWSLSMENWIQWRQFPGHAKTFADLYPMG
jgi:hypothetical protein